MREKGFTLIELMIVISLIGTLAAIALPAYGDYLIRGQVAEGMALTTDIKKQVSEYYKATGSFPKDNLVAGVPPADKLLGNYVKNIAVKDGVLNVTFGQKSHKSIDGKVLSLRPIYVADSPMSPISWVCGYSSVPDGMTAQGVNMSDLETTLLPTTCRAL